MTMLLAGVARRRRRRGVITLTAMTAAILISATLPARAQQSADDAGPVYRGPAVIEIRPLSSTPAMPTMPSPDPSAPIWPAPPASSPASPALNSAGPSSTADTRSAPPGDRDETIEIRKLPGDVPGLTAPPLPPASPPPPAGPRSENGVTWECGGVGLDEAARMKQAARDHALLLVFAQKSGSYMANVTVRLIDPSGAVRVRTRCDAPMMWIDVDTPGTWQVDARGLSDGAGPGAGVPKTASVRLQPGQKDQRLVMVWPD